MSLILTHRLEVETSGSQVLFGVHLVTMEDFLEAAWYVLANTDLAEKGDPREAFVERVKQLQPGVGRNPGARRLKEKVKK